MHCKIISKLIPKFEKNEKGKKVFCGFYIAACIIIMYLFAAYTISALLDGVLSPLLLAPTAAFFSRFLLLYSEMLFLKHCAQYFSAACMPI